MAKSATTEEKAVAPTGCIAFQWKATDHAAEKKATTRMDRVRRSWLEMARNNTAGMVKAKIQMPTGGQLKPNNSPPRMQPARRTPECLLVTFVKLNGKEFDCAQG